MSKRRFSAIRRSGTLPQHTPAAHERPLVVPPAPRAHSSHSHSSQKKRDETTSLVAAGGAVAAAVEDVEDEQLDENSEAYDTMDDAKSRDLVAEFSNDTVPKAAFTALADAGQSWDHEDRDIAVSAVPPFTRTSPPSTVPARRASHGALAHAAAAEAPVEAPVAAASVVAAPVEAPVEAPVVAPVEAVAVPSPAEAEAVPESKKSAKKRAVPNVSHAARSAPSVVKARKVVAEQTASGRGRRGEGKLSARDMFRQTRQIATEFEVVEKQHAIDENVSAPKRANNKPDVAKQSKAAVVAQQTKRSHVTFISATPDTNQQRNVPRTPKKSKSTAAAAAAIDPRALICMVQDNDDKNWRETKLLVTNSRLLPTTASRRAGSVLNASMALGRMLAQVHVAAPGDDSPSASAQRSGSKSVRRALPLDTVRTK